MALSGTLHDFGLADILQLIGIQRKTGVLVLKHGNVRVVVSFLNGGVVSADSSEQALEDRLGSVLVKSGKITERQLSEALKIQKSTLKRLGRILVDQKSISVEDLQESLRVQVTQIVHHLFRWRDGEYDFSQEESIDYDREHFLPIPAENILMEGARMLDEWPIIERRIRHFEMVVRRKNEKAQSAAPISVFETDIDFDLAAAGAEPDDEVARLNREEAFVYRLVDGRSTIQDIIDRSPLGEFETCRILYELMMRDLLEEGLGEAAHRPEAAPAPPRRSILLRAALWALPFAAAMSLLYSPASPLSPVRSGRASDPIGLERIRLHLSQARAGRIDRALRIFYLDRQDLPTSLDSLGVEGFLDPKDLIDPWGRPYGFRIESKGYVISALGPKGAPEPSISIESQFVAAQRLALEGGTDEPVAKADTWP